MLHADHSSVGYKYQIDGRELGQVHLEKELGIVAELCLTSARQSGEAFKHV